MTFEIFLMCLFFILGAVAGSFLNVCIVRMPQDRSVIFPPSHCIHCQKQILWQDNIPLVSYLILGGRCRFCKNKFSSRYFWVELLTAFTFVAFYLYFGLTPVVWPYLLMAAGFIVAIFVDFEHRIIPDEISVGGALAGFVCSFLVPDLHNVPIDSSGALWGHAQSLLFSILGAVVGGGLVYAMGILGSLLFKKEAMGGGDVKFLAMVGAFLGWKYALLSFFIAPFFGAVFGIVEMIRTKDRTIAYGPFLALGALISLFFGDQIIEWVMGYGIYSF